MRTDQTDDRTETPASHGRRSFLFSAAGAGLAGAALATGLKQDGATPEAPESTAGQGKGYRLSEHVQRYYRSTRL